MPVFQREIFLLFAFFQTHWTLLIYLMTAMMFRSFLFLSAECKSCLMVSDKLHSCPQVYSDSKDG